jgi:LysR family glycine cleavage system transcriptional activator
LKRPRLNILRTFEAAGRRLSFSLAADELNISQAAVSQQMRQLEAYLNVPLFVRHHRRLSLTSTGQAYLDAVHEALDRLDSITDQLFPGRQHQAVTLHCTSSVATLWLAPQLRSFQKSYPNIDLRINTLDLGYENRRSSGADLEIFTAGDIIKDAYTTKLLTSTILPVCSAKLFAKGPQLELPADVLKHELIHVLGYDDDWHRWFRKFQLNNVDVPHGLSVDSSLIAIEAVQRGDGIMLGRRPFIDHYLESGELVEVFKKPFCLYTDYNLRQPSQVSGQHASATVAMWLTGLVDSRDIQRQFT